MSKSSWPCWRNAATADSGNGSPPEGLTIKSSGTDMIRTPGHLWSRSWLRKKSGRGRELRPEFLRILLHRALEFVAFLFERLSRIFIAPLGRTIEVVLALE